MTLLYYDPRFLEHDTGRNHPERATRVRHVAEHLEKTGIEQRCARPEWTTATRGRLELVHERSYIERVESLARRGGGALDPDTVVSQESYEVARLAAGAVCDAVDRVLRGEDKTAFCLVRPPGHHAIVARAMGFCLFNNVAVAARVAIKEHGLKSVLIADWDVHHGNGTQDIFYEDGRVGFLSIHRSHFYPGTGAADETGSGDGVGTTRNLPIDFGTPRETQLKRFREELQKLADRLRPELVIVSAGFDAHRRDPIGSLGLETEDFAEYTNAVQEVAATHAGGRIVSALEGGYNPTVLAECVETHLSELLR